MARRNASSHPSEPAQRQHTASDQEHHGEGGEQRGDLDSFALALEAAIDAVEDASELGIVVGEEVLAAGRLGDIGQQRFVEGRRDAEAVERYDGAAIGADANGVDRHAGIGIPLIRALRESLIGERLTRLMGIVNGTTNFILTKMTEEGADYGEVLAEAQRLGYAEADPTADVEGFDAGAKAAILATIAFGARVVAGDVFQEGISKVTPADIAAAASMGHVIKLLAVVEREEGEIAVRVHPTMVPDSHPLASVRDSFNAVFLEGEAVDDLMLYGRGAGGFPTASAMLGDLIGASRNLQRSVADGFGHLSDAVIRPIDETSSAFYLQLDVNDQPGVLAAVAGIFGEHGVSIRSMEQEGHGDTAHLVFITHSAREADVQSTIRDLRELDQVRDIGALIRVIGD